MIIIIMFNDYYYIKDFSYAINYGQLNPYLLGYRNSSIGNFSQTTHSLIDTPFQFKNGYPNVNLKRYPLYAKAKFKKYILGAGDVLLIPGNWGHLIFSENAITLSYFYHSNIGNNILPQLSKINWLNNSSWEKLKSELKLTNFTGMCRISPDEHFYPYLKYNETDSKRWVSSVDIIFNTFYKLINTFKKDNKKFNSLFFGDLTYSPIYQILQKHIDLSLHHNIRDKVWLWCKDGKTVTGLHKDEKSNYLHCLSGKMTVFLFSPSEQPYLYYARELHRRETECRDEYLHKILQKYSLMINYYYNPIISGKKKYYVKYIVIILVLFLLIFYLFKEKKYFNLNDK